MYYKKEYVIPVINLKQALNQRLVLKKVHRAIKFNQKIWLESYIDMNTELRKMEKMILGKKTQANEQCSFYESYGENIEILSL